MNKLFPLLIVLVSILILPGCEGREKNSGADTFDFHPPEYSFDRGYPATYKGFGSRVWYEYTASVDEKQNGCTNNDDFTLTFEEPDKVTLYAVGACYDEQCNVTGDNCGYTLVGKYTKDKKGATSYVLTGSKNGFMTCTGGGKFGDLEATIEWVKCKEAPGRGDGRERVFITSATVSHQ